MSAHPDILAAPTSTSQTIPRHGLHQDTRPCLRRVAWDDSRALTWLKNLPKFLDSTIRCSTAIWALCTERRHKAQHSRYFACNWESCGSVVSLRHNLRFFKSHRRTLRGLHLRLPRTQTRSLCGTHSSIKQRSVEMKAEYDSVAHGRRHNKDCQSTDCN